MRAPRRRRVVVPEGLPSTFAPDGLELLADTPPLDRDTLATADGVLTTCALAIAETGTIILDAGAGQGRRALTLLPDLHICIVPTDRIVANVPDAIAQLDGTSAPVTFIEAHPPRPTSSSAESKESTAPAASRSSSPASVELAIVEHVGWLEARLARAAGR